MKRLLSKIFESNLHNDTLIIFYSDHGIRFGQILKTESGFHESRLPFLYFHIPENMKLLDNDGNKLNARKIREMIQLNTRRLTSQHDIHASLRHLLNQVPPVDEYYGQSLFTSISLDRTCEDAGIPDDYCLCRQFVPFNESSTIATLSSHILAHLNSELKPFSTKCAKLELNKILKVKITSQNFDNNLKIKSVSKRTFSMKILTSPSNGTIEATLQAMINKVTGTISDPKSVTIIGNVVRLDRYAEQSYCAANTAVESFCYCKNLL